MVIHSGFKMGPWKPGPSSQGHTINIDSGPLSNRPLAQYLLPLTRKHKDGYDSLGPFNKNMYLAEDRVLCFELVAKKREKNILRYVKGAVGKYSSEESGTQMEHCS